MQLLSQLLQSLQGTEGYNEAAFVAAHQQPNNVTSIRLNPTKLIDPQKHFTPNTITAIPWANQGYYLGHRPKFTLDPLLHGGCYYVQEASSMLLEQVLLQTNSTTTPLKVLDLCAAPGGKSTHLQSVLHKDSMVVSNETIGTRNAILEENMIKWSAANVVITQNDAKDFAKLNQYFDVIVIDAPCSGSGLIRKDAYAMEHWSIDNVNLCNQRQQRIIADVLPALKPNGLLIYSTCSYSYLENEAIADWACTELGMQTVSIATHPTWGITTSTTPLGNYGYRCWPYLANGEGFFISAFTHTGCTPQKHFAKQHDKRTIKITATTLELAIIQPWLIPNHNLHLVTHQQQLYAINTMLLQELSQLQQCLYIKLIGIQIGSIAQQKLVPNHALAVSVLCNTNLPHIQVHLYDAINYLKKENLQLDIVDKGWVLVKYNNVGLGWLKNMGNRINNYYPKNWRILMPNTV